MARPASVAALESFFDVLFFGNFMPKNPENKLKAFSQITIIPIG
jgi:hypothetical protein